MIRVLLDQGLAPRAADLLRRGGWDAIHVPEIGSQSADDSVILGTARTQDRVCVALDRDFHTHLAMTGAGRPSVIFVRVQGIDEQGQASLIRTIGGRYADELREGAAVSATEK